MPSESSTYAGIRMPVKTQLTPGVLARTQIALRDRLSRRRSAGSKGSIAADTAVLCRWLLLAAWLRNADIRLCSASR